MILGMIRKLIMSALTNYDNDHGDDNGYASYGCGNNHPFTNKYCTEAKLPDHIGADL